MKDYSNTIEEKDREITKLTADLEKLNTQLENLSLEYQNVSKESEFSLLKEKQLLKYSQDIEKENNLYLEKNV